MEASIKDRSYLNRVLRHQAKNPLWPPYVADKKFFSVVSSGQFDSLFKKLPTLCRMEEEGMCSFVDAVWERVVGSRSNRTNCHPFNI